MKTLTEKGVAERCDGLKWIDASSSAIISSLEVIVTIAMAVIILGESVTLLKVAGTLLVLSAVVILARGEYRATYPPVPR